MIDQSYFGRFTFALTFVSSVAACAPQEAPPLPQQVEIEPAPITPPEPEPDPGPTPRSSPSATVSQSQISLPPDVVQTGE
ncbi:MAG: hypothetical protein AAF719_06100 [Pseudomonadota bacterium]